MFESQPVHLDSFLPKRGATLPVQFQVPLSQLPTGKYTCQVNLIDENGHKFAFERANIQMCLRKTARRPPPLPRVNPVASDRVYLSAVPSNVILVSAPYFL
jgi:hypothetical protein